MRFERSCGLLLHLSSLPSEYGIGEVGPAAHAFVDLLADAGQRWWQVLPLGPSDRGHPYLAQSSQAGSPLLVSLDELVEVGDLDPLEVEPARDAYGSLVDFPSVIAQRERLMPLAAKRFFRRGDHPARQRYEQFCADEANWLDDWALYAAAKVHFGLRPWWEWPRDLALHRPAALRRFSDRLADGMAVARYVQWRFFEQWTRLREHAHSRGVRLIGDLPIYCSRDSMDVWASRKMFQLDGKGVPEVVSGVPPDYFAKDGQLWGTPVYDWPVHEKQGYAWWLGRLTGVLRHVDVVRIDHFRAFESYWEVPADAETARTGRWVPGPRDAFFQAVRDALGDAPLIAEDLGIITRAVRELRDRWELPGMRVLQFAFGQGAASPHLPVYHPDNSVVYTSTHDNDTSVGWYDAAPDWEQDCFRRYTASDGGSPHWHLIHTAYGSVADLAIVPVQDVLGLGSEARMNTPGIADGNWRWKLVPGQLEPGAGAMIRDLAGIFGRLPGQGMSELDGSPAE